MFLSESDWLTYETAGSSSGFKSNEEVRVRSRIVKRVAL